MSRAGASGSTPAPSTRSPTAIPTSSAAPLRVVDRLVIGVARNDGKGPLFSTDERVEIVRDEIAHLENGGAERIEVRAVRDAC